MSLRKGKTKSILESSIDSALLAVEIYNKPRTAFRVENYISLMIIAWTKLFHAYFNNTMGDKFYYKSGNRYKLVDGERKAWELSTCIKKYNQLPEAIYKNIELFISLRNKIEHRHIEKETLGVQIFGECQALLYNYENMLIKLFGEEYAINENLAFSLQFSRVLTKEQREAQKNVLSHEAQSILDFISKFRTSLSTQVFDSQEYSIKLIQIPKVSNTSRNDLAVEFINWNDLTQDEKNNVQKLTAIIKDKTIRIEGANVGKLKPKDVAEKINNMGIEKFSVYSHVGLWNIFNVRPKENSNDPFNTNTKYCHYDEVHKDYVFNEKWVDFIYKLLTEKKLTLESISAYYLKEEKLRIEDYE
jgi:uncharacterized protein YdhG (YjbR/CyaY superfamily)